MRAGRALSVGYLQDVEQTVDERFAIRRLLVGQPAELRRQRVPGRITAVGADFHRGDARERTLGGRCREVQLQLWERTFRLGPAGVAAEETFTFSIGLLRPVWLPVEMLPTTL